MDDTNNSPLNNDNQDLSKRERREARKEERMRDQSATRRENNIKRYGLWGGMLVGLAVLIWALAQYGGGTTSGDLAKAVTDADWSKGKADATVVLVEYGDFQCPACAAYFGLVRQVAEEYKDRVKVVYRHFPLKNIHPNAELSAKAAEAAGKQGKFWQMHDHLFDNQSAWAALSNAKAKEIFISYAKTLGLNVDQFSKDMDSDEIADLVNEDADSANASNVTATPTFFLNGKKITSPQSVDQFRALFDNAL